MTDPAPVPVPTRLQLEALVACLPSRLAKGAHIHPTLWSTPATMPPFHVDAVDLAHGYRIVVHSYVREDSGATWTIYHRKERVWLRAGFFDGPAKAARHFFVTNVDTSRR